MEGEGHRRKKSRHNREKQGGDREHKKRFGQEEGHRKRHKKNHGHHHHFKHGLNQESSQIVQPTLESKRSEPNRHPNQFKRRKHWLKRQQSQIKDHIQSPQKQRSKPQHPHSDHKHNFFKEFNFNRRRRSFYHSNLKEKLSNATSTLLSGILSLGMSELKTTEGLKEIQQQTVYQSQHYQSVQQLEGVLCMAIPSEQQTNYSLQVSNRQDRLNKSEQNTLNQYLTRIPMHVIKILKQKNKIDDIVDIISSITLDFLSLDWNFRKIMLQIFWNLINFQKFKQKDESNIYIANNNSLKNSQGLRKTLIQNKVEHPEYFVQQSSKYMTLKKQVCSFPPINASKLSDIVNQQLDSLQQMFKQDFITLKENDPKNQSQIQYIITKIISSEYTKKLKQTLLLKLKKPGQLRQQQMGIVCHTIIKIFILSSVKCLMIQSFSSDKFNRQNEVMSNNMERCMLLSQKSNIYQFQLCYIANRAKTGKCVLRQDIISFFDGLDNNDFTGLQQLISYFLQILIFMKKTIAVGFGIKLNDDNIYHRICRFAFRLQQPFDIYKNQEQLMGVNQKLAKSLLTMKDSIKEIFNANRVNLYKIYQQNLQYLKGLFQYQILEKLEEQQSEKISTILRLFDLDFEIEKVNQQSLIEKCIHIKGQLNEHVDEQCPQMNYLQKLDHFQLMQEYLITKFETIIRKIFSVFCYESSSKVSLRFYHTFIKGLQNQSQPLTTMYNNLFDEDEQQQQIAKKREKYKEYLPSYELKKQNQQLTNIYSISQKLLKVDNKSIFTGILGLEEYKEEYWLNEIKQQYLDKTKTIQFCEMNPEQGRSLLFKKMLPADLSKQKSSFIETVLKQQVKSQKKQFCRQDLSQVIKRFIQNVRLIFLNFTSLEIRCPIFLIRHLILHKQLRLDNYPQILPQINIVRCMVQNDLANSIKPLTYLWEYYINAVLRVHNLSLSTHNQLIGEIFLRFLAQSRDERTYLQQIFVFVQNIKTDENVLIKFKKYYTAQRNTNNSHIYFSKLHSRYAQQFFKQILNLSQYPMDLNEKIISNEISKLIRSKFAQDEVFLSNSCDSKYRSHSYLLNNLQYSLYCFKAIKYRCESLGFSQRLQEGFNQHLEALFKLHYCNMLYLYKEYERQVRRPKGQKKYQHLSLVCEVSNSNVNNKEINYHYLFRQTDLTPFQAYIMLQNYGYTNSYYQQQYSNMDNLNRIIREKQQFFYSIDSTQKHRFLNDLVELLHESSDNRLNIQIWNLNVHSIDLVCQKSEDNSQHYINTVRPSFSNWQWFRCFKKGLYQLNNDTYIRFYRFLHKQADYDIQKFCLQANYTCLNIPKYHQRVNIDTTAQYFLQFRSKTPAYDIGNVGYVMAILLVRSNTSQDIDCSIIQKIRQIYHPSESQKPNKIAEDMANIIRPSIPTKLCDVILCMMNPLVEKRIEMGQLSRQFASQMMRDQVEQLSTYFNMQESNPYIS